MKLGPEISAVAPRRWIDEFAFPWLESHGYHHKVAPRLQSAARRAVGKDKDLSPLSAGPNFAFPNHNFSGTLAGLYERRWIPQFASLPRHYAPVVPRRHRH